MYSLPKDLDLSFFKGKELIQLCLGQNEFILNFFQNISISVEAGGFTIRNKRYKGQEYSQKGYILHVLLGKKILSALHGKDAGDLVLMFEDGNELILHDAYKEYHSYSFLKAKIL